MGAPSWCHGAPIAALFAVVAPLFGCAEIAVRSGDQVVVRRAMGLAPLALRELTEPISITTRGAGIVLGPRHWAIGWLDEEMVIFPDTSKCRMMIVVREHGDIEAVVSVLRAAAIPPGGVCIQGGA